MYISIFYICLCLYQGLIVSDNVSTKSSPSSLLRTKLILRGHSSCSMVMAPSRVISLLCVLVVLISHTTAQESFRSYSCNNGIGNYTANSTYQTNLNTLLSSLSSNTQIDYGFYNFSQGQDPDKVYAIGMCRGDVKPDECRSCLNDSRVLLTQLCPNQKEAIGWYDTCMLRYSNRSIFGIVETSPVYYVYALNNATDMDQFNQGLRELVDSLGSKAASGDSLKKYAAGSTQGPSFQTIFALLQCTPDLSKQQCNDCLVGTITDIQSCCAGKINGRIGKPSCNLRFDTSPFYDPTADAPQPPPSQAPPPPSVTNTTSSPGTYYVLTMYYLTLSYSNSSLHQTISKLAPLKMFYFVALFSFPSDNKGKHNCFANVQPVNMVFWVSKFQYIIEYLSQCSTCNSGFCRKEQHNTNCHCGNCAYCCHLCTAHLGLHLLKSKEVKEKYRH